MPGTAAAQRLGGSAAGDISLVRVFLALLACLLIAIMAVLLLRYRLGGRFPSLMPRLVAARGRIQLLESRRISLQAEVSLIAFEDREYLILVGAGGALLLNDRSAAESPAGDGTGG